MGFYGLDSASFEKQFPLRHVTVLNFRARVLFTVVWIDKASN